MTPRSTQRTAFLELPDDGLLVRQIELDIQRIFATYGNRVALELGAVIDAQGSIRYIGPSFDKHLNAECPELRPALYGNPSLKQLAGSGGSGWRQRFPVLT